MQYSTALLGLCDHKYFLKFSECYNHIQVMNNTNHQKKEPQPSQPRNRRYFMAAMLLIIYALVGWLRLYNSLRFWNYLQELGLRPSPLYLALSGGLIAIAFTIAFFLCIMRMKSCGLFSRIICVLFLLWFWLDGICLRDREKFLYQLPVTILITAATLILMFFMNRPVTHDQGDIKDEQ